MVQLLSTVLCASCPVLSCQGKGEWTPLVQLVTMWGFRLTSCIRETSCPRHSAYLIYCSAQ